MKCKFFFFFLGSGGGPIMCNCILCENLSTMNNEYCEFECVVELGSRLFSFL